MESELHGVLNRRAQRVRDAKLREHWNVRTFKRWNVSRSSSKMGIVGTHPGCFRMSGKYRTYRREVCMSGKERT